MQFHRFASFVRPPAFYGQFLWPFKAGSSGLVLVLTVRVNQVRFCGLGLVNNCTTWNPCELFFIV